MESVVAKRPRSENFTFDDRSLLLEKIKSKKYTVENKKTDKATQHAKDIAWMQITNEYNSIASTPRTLENLKYCWENLKKKYRSTIANKSFDMKSRNITQFEKILNKKIGHILTSAQDQPQSLHHSNSLNSECDRDLDDSLSCSSEDLLYSETKLKECSERLPHLMRFEDIEKIESMENKAGYESKTGVPYVLMLTSHDSNSDSETQNENITKTLKISPQKVRNGINFEMNNHKKYDRNTSKRQQHLKTKDMNYAIAEAKLELAKLAKEHAFAEERRKAELHELQIQKAKLEIELMKLQLLNKKSQLLM